MVELLSAKAPGGATARPGDYRLDTSLVRTVEGDTDVTLVLHSVADQRAIWSQPMRLTSDETPEFTASETQIAQLARAHTVIHHAQIPRQPDNCTTSFPCPSHCPRTPN